MVIGRYHVTWALPFVKCSVDVTNANARDSTENERVKISKYIHSLKVEISDTSILKILFQLIGVVCNLYAFPENTCEKSFFQFTYFFNFLRKRESRKKPK